MDVGRSKSRDGHGWTAGGHNPPYIERQARDALQSMISTKDKRENDKQQSAERVGSDICPESSPRVDFDLCMGAKDGRESTWR